jgi:hypothetical protein
MEELSALELELELLQRQPCAVCGRPSDPGFECCIACARVVAGGAS